MSVADVDASCTAAKTNGGAVPWGPVDVPNVGRMAMVAAADAAGTVLMIGPSHGYDPPVDLAARLIASGEADRATEKWLQRSRLMRRDTWRRCAESRHNMRRGGE
mgnify:CR=1 FL=1